MRSHVSPLFSRVVGARPWQALLASDEPPACEVINAGGAGTAFLVCDHASNRVPRLLGNLGLEPAQLADHIGWDPGAAEVARRLSGHLDAPLGLSGYSRLAVDCNRPPDSRESITEQSAGVSVPGESGAHARRSGDAHRPYHEAITQLLDRRAGRPSLLLSIHSFTPELAGQRRPWDNRHLLRARPRTCRAHARGARGRRETRRRPQRTLSRGPSTTRSRSTVRAADCRMSWSRSGRTASQRRRTRPRGRCDWRKPTPKSSRRRCASAGRHFDDAEVTVTPRLIGRRR